MDERFDFDRDPRLLSEFAGSMGLGVFRVDAAGQFAAWSQGAEVKGIENQECRIRGAGGRGIHLLGNARLLRVLREREVQRVGDEGILRRASTRGGPRE